MKTYIIPKGWHYSLHLPKLYDGVKKEFIIKVKPDNSWRYYFHSVDQIDINKLWGIGFGNVLFDGPHTNSIRLGWNYNPNNDSINWWYYYYENSIRNYDYLTTSFINEDIEFPFQLKDESFLIGNKEIPYIYPQDRTGYYLFPYFGGNRTAPHMIINKLEVN